MTVPPAMRCCAYPRLMSANPPGWITPPVLRLTGGDGLPTVRV